MEIEITKGDNLGVRKPRKEVRSHKCKHHQQNTREERIPGTEDTIENIDTTIKESAKCTKILTQNIQDIQDTMRRPNLRIIGIEESNDSLLKRVSKYLQQNYRRKLT